MATGTVYTNQGLLKEFTANALANNRIVDGVVMQGQAPYILAKIIEESNAKYEGQGTGNKKINIFEERIAYDGDATVKAQVATAAAVTGGIRITFSDPNYVGFRVNDNIDTIFGGNQARVVEVGSGYAVVSTLPGYTAPIAGDYTSGSTVITRKRSIELRGTQAPSSINTVPRLWKNYPSVMDDGGQQNLWDSLNQTNISDAMDYITIAPVTQAIQRAMVSKYMTMLTSRKVNPETNGQTFTATSGWIEQIEDGGMYVPLTSLISRTEFEQRLRRWYVNNPGNPMENRFVKTGSIGFALISEWYKDFMKFDAPIAMNFTDGGINGLNATRVWIPGFDYINIVKDPMQDMDINGAYSNLAGYTDMPKTSADFWFMDMTPVRMSDSGRLAPAIQQFYMGDKYYYAFERGLQPAASLAAALSAGNAMSVENLANTSTTNDFNSFRVWMVCGSNLLNRSQFGLLKNFV